MMRFTRMLWVGILAGIGLCCLFPRSVHAVTVTGTDIRVDYIGTAGPTDLTYRVTMVIYTQCDNSGTIGLKDTAGINVSSQSRGISMHLTLKRLPSQPGDILSPYCPGVATSCDDPSLMNTRPGFMKTTYTEVISLPFQADDWVFYYFQVGNGRGNTSSNLCYGNIMHVGALCVFNNLDRYNNSSPRFTIDPYLSYLNVNQPAKIFNGAYDPDLDSIVTTPHKSLGCILVTGNPCPCGQYSQLDYAPGSGYTTDNPVNAPGGYYVNPRTGTASFMPVSIGGFAFGFKCEDFDRRTGKSLGYVIRDVAIPVTYYAGGNFTIDSLPSNISGAIAAPSGSTDLVVCPGTKMDFDIGAQSVGGSLYLNADRTTASGSTFTVTGNGSATPSGRFSWTPGVQDLGTHVIKISAVDSACNNASFPMIHQKNTTITIHVIGGIDLGPDRFYCGPQTGEPMVLASSPVVPGITYEWTSLNGSAPEFMDNAHAPNPKIMPSHTVTYVLSAKGLPVTCKIRDTIIVEVDSNTLTVTPRSPVELCEGEHLELDANATGLPPRENVSCELTGRLPNTPLDSISPIPVNGVLQNGNNPQSTPFNALKTSRHQYLVRASDLLAAGLHSGTLTGMNFFLSGNASGGSFQDFKLYLKCTPMSALDANAFEQGVIPVYASRDLAVPASGVLHIDFDAWYNWDTTQNLIVEICYTSRTGTDPVFTDNYPTIYTSCLYTSNASGNSVCGGGVSSTGPSNVHELPRMEFFFHAMPEVDFQYAWVRIMGNYVSDTAAKSPSIDIDQRTKYYITTYDRKGCLLRDSLDVFVSDRDFHVTPVDTAICEGDTIKLRASGGAYYQWYEEGFNPPQTLSCTDCDIASAFPTNNTAYKIVISDSLHCADTLSANIRILPRSTVHILNNDTTISYGASVQLVAEGAEQYFWSPPDYLDNPNIQNPIASPLKSITYTVTGGSSAGICRSTDSVRININFQGQPLIPSAFSPNGDGLNDVFKIENLGFRRILVFQIFNRYGQEVYQAPLGNMKGWDGTFKGKPANTGTYFYYIQLELPDGKLNTYRGDITLLR